MAEAEGGLAPSVRLITSHTVRSGSPSLHSVTRLRAKAYTIGPLVPSETVRPYHAADGKLSANAVTVSGACVAEATTRLTCTAPLEGYVCSVVGGRWSQQRVSAGTDTNAVTPTQASMASRKAGLLPERQSATRDRKGRRPSFRIALTMSAAIWGLVCKGTS